MKLHVVSLFIPFVFLLIFDFTLRTILMSVLTMSWVNIGILFKTRDLFGINLNRKALAKIGIYVLIITFLIFYQFYFFGSDRIVFAATVTTTTTSTTTSTTSTTTTTTIPPTGIPLQPGTVEFSISAIYMPSGEINFTGNTTHLNTYWEAYYYDGSQRDIGAVCFLNCDERYNSTCPAPWNCSCPLIQNCSTLTPPGKGVCSIINPNYNSPYNNTNFVGCRFSDPLFPTTAGHINKTFVPIDFSVWFSSFTSIVGEEFNLPVNIKNQGLFTDTYSVNSSTNMPYIVNINTPNFSLQLHGDSFDPHAWQQTGPEVKQVYIKVTILDASKGPPSKNLCINVSSSLEPKFFIYDCKSLEAQFKVLSELDLTGFLLIMLIASAFIFKIKRRF